MMMYAGMEDSEKGLASVLYILLNINNTNLNVKQTLSF